MIQTGSRNRARRKFTGLHETARPSPVAPKGSRKPGSSFRQAGPPSPACLLIFDVDFRVLPSCA
jgi:hypothetical protein